MRPYTQITVSGEWCIGVVEKDMYILSQYGTHSTATQKLSGVARAAGSSRRPAPRRRQSRLDSTGTTLAWSAASLLLTARTQTRGGY